MILPFVREMIADLEHTDSFERLRRHLAGGLGRRRVSGLTATARALYLPLMVRASNAPALILGQRQQGGRGAAQHPERNLRTDRRTALRRGAAACPRTMCCRLKNLSPHAEISGTARQRSVEDLHQRGASVVIAPA